MLEREEEKYLKRCAHSLLKRCDGAQKKDGKGFSKYDIDSVRDIANKKSLTHPQANALKRTLLKYEGQLEEIGYSSERIRNIDTAVYEEDNVKVWFEGDDINLKMVIRSPYNEQFLQRVRSLPSDARDWDGNRRVWKVKVDYANTYPVKVLDWLYEVYNVNLNPEIPDRKFGKVSVESDKLIFEVGHDDRFKKKIKEATYSKFNGDVWIMKIKTIDDIALVHTLIDMFDLKHEGVKTFLEMQEEKVDNRKRRKERIQELSQKTTLDDDEDIDISLPDEDLELHPFQKVGTQILNLREKGFLCDEMGCGKTPQVLAHLYNKNSLRPVLVVVPSSVKINWKREIKKWTDALDSRIYLLEGTTNSGIPEDCTWYVINYAIVNQRLEDLKKINFNAIIIDESHYVKNHDAKRTKAVLELAKKTEHTYCLTGTPMPNKPIELYSQLRALNVEEVPEFNALFGKNGFGKKFCGAHKKRAGNREWWDLSGQTNLDELHEKLRKNIMIRRKKSQVLDELPEKHRMMVSLDIDNRREYQSAVDDFKKWSEGVDYGSADLVVQMEKLKQLTWKGKYDDMVDWIDNAMKTGEKTILWAHHKDLQRKLYDHYSDRALKITSGMTSSQKQDVVDEFTEGDEKDVCVASIKSANVGMNLQASSRAIFCELAWTPSEHSQAEDRQHRKGQEDDRVDIYYLVGENTIEEDIFRLINEKQKVSDKALDGVEDDDKKGIAIKIAENLKEEDYR